MKRRSLAGLGKILIASDICSEIASHFTSDIIIYVPESLEAFSDGMFEGKDIQTIFKSVNKNFGTIDELKDLSKYDGFVSTT